MARTKKKDEVTLKFIAETLGISVATVSLAVNRGKGYERISEETIRKVEEACKQYGYSPNFYAQALKRNTSMQIGLAISDMFDRFEAELVQGVKEVLSESGYSTIVLDFTDDNECNTPIAEVEKAFSPLIHGGIDGIITHVAESALKSLNDVQIPIVYVDHSKESLPGVGFDGAQASYLATRVFTEQGCKRIAYIGASLNAYTFTQRLEGYLTALKEANLSEREELITYVDGSINGGHEAFNWLMSMAELPEAVVIFTDEVAHIVQSLLVQNGVRIPEQIGIASIDDTVFSKYMIPPLTSVHVPARAMGRSAAELMLQMLRKPQEVRNQYKLVDIELNVRASSQIAKEE